MKEPALDKCSEERALDASCETGEGASEFGEKPADWSSVLTTLDGLNNEVRTLTTLLEAGVKLSEEDKERRKDGLGRSSV